MSEQLPEIFVDFNRRTAAPDTFVTWAAELGDAPIVLGSRVRLTDLEDLQFEGFISGVSSDLKSIYVTRGSSPVAAAEASMHLASLDIDVRNVPQTRDRHIKLVA